MKNTTILAITLLVIVLIAGGIFFKANTEKTGTTETITNSPPQKVVLSLQNYNYYPNTVTVKAGQPVQLSLDKSVQGCLRSFTIPELGVKKVLATPQDMLEFTPTTKGTYKFQCSMGMGYGTLIVE